MERNPPSKLSFAQNIVIIVVLLILLGSCLTTIFLVNNNEQLESQLVQRDSLISRIQIGDSIYSSTLRDYSETITKYISDCNFLIDGKSVSTTEVIDFINDLSRENSSLEDSLDYFKRKSEAESSYLKEIEAWQRKIADSLVINSKFVELAKEDYGISYNIKREENYYIFEREITTADSALILFPYYKKNISRDTSTGNWVIITGTKLIVEQREKNTKKSKRRN